MLPVLVLLSIYCNLAHGIRDPWVKPTPRYLDNEYLFDGWTPKPTAAPAPRIRNPWGVIGAKELFPRDIVSTCGYVDADPNQPVTCGAGSECAFIYDVEPQYWQCCPIYSGSAVDWGQCTNYVDCVNYEASSSGYPNQGSIPYGDSQTVFCPPNNPICYTAFLAQEAEGATYLSYGCWTDTYTEFIFEQATAAQQTYSDLYSYPSTQSRSDLSQPVSDPPTTSGPADYSGITTSSLLPPSVTESDDPTSADVQTTSNTPDSVTSGPTATPTFSIPHGGTHTTDRNAVSPASGGGNTGAPDPSPTPTETGKSSNVGAIAGGVVGGVVVLAAVGAGIAYMMLRKRKQRVEPMREISPGYYAPDRSLNY